MSTPEEVGVETWSQGAFCGQTCVDSNAQAQLFLGPMADAEGADSIQQCKCHSGHLSGMELSIPHGEP